MTEVEESRIMSDNSDSAQGNFARVSMETMNDTSPNKEMTKEEAENKARVNETNEPTQEENLFAGKYKSVEDLEKAYNELQTKLGQTSEQKTDAPAAEATDKAADDNLFDTAYDEWSESGKLSDETIAALEKTGIPKQYVEQFVRNANAEQELIQQGIINEIGGQQEFERLSNWATQNLKQAEIDTFNGIVESGDVEQIKFAFNSLKARAGNTKFISPDNNTISSDAQSFASKAEMVKAMSDPRYVNDRAYRQKVERMVMRSRL